MTQPVDIGPCYHCKEPMWMARGTYDTYLRNHQSFYCTHGHLNCYREGPSEADKLRQERDRLAQRIAQKDDEIDRQRRLRECAERSASAYKGQTTRLKNRAKAGVCPCCNRTFKQLAAHMATQHPDFTKELPE